MSAIEQKTQTKAETMDAMPTEVTSLTTALDNPVAVLTDPSKFDVLLGAIKREAEAHKPDLSTDRGRKAIASLAFKIARTKTALDDAGKKLNEEARQRINTVDAARRDIREKLDALRDEVRAPLTAWEKAEEARVQSCATKLAMLRNLGRIEVGETSETVKHRIATVKGIEVTSGEFQDDYDAAMAQKEAALESLHQGMERLLREEREREELERLRAEAAARAEAERLAAEEAARAQVEAERAERERRAAEEAERARQDAIARAAKEAEERARREAEVKARAEQEERERAHREEVARERRAREEAEAATQREAKRREDEERARQDAARREQEETARRAADREHRGTVLKAAKEALMEHAEIGEEQAKKVVLAIAGGSVPAVSIRF